MTDQELKDLVASLALDTKVMKAEAEKRTAEADRRDAEANRRIAKIEQFLRESKEENDRRFKETDQQLRETDRQLRETDRQLRETDRQLRELGKQIGGLSNKFGTFTEGMTLPSVKQLLFERFGVEDVMPSRRKRMGAETMETDALGIINGTRNEAYIVEIKSHLRKDSIEQVIETLKKFRRIFPEYSGLKLYGIIVAASTNEESLQLAKQCGFYVIAFDDNLMTFHDDEGFVPKSY